MGVFVRTQLPHQDVLWTVFITMSFLTTLEDTAELATKTAKPVLPHLARILLVATFLEDGVRMWTQFVEQREYIMILWGCGHFLASLFVVINRFLTNVACGMRIFIILLQTIGFGIVFDWHFILRNLALSGAVLLVAAEAWAEDKSTIAGVPSVGEDKKPKSYLQLTGRVLLVFLFLSLIRFEADASQMIYTLVTSALMGLISIGPGVLVVRPQHHPQLLLDDQREKAVERLPPLRLLPDPELHGRLVDGGGDWSWRGVLR